MVSARSILLLLLSAVVTCAQVCPNATISDTSYFAFTVHLFYGTNTTCTGDEEIAVRNTINDALTNMNVTQSGGPLQEISGDICTDDGDSIDDDILNRNLVVIQKWSWNGRMSKCQNCYVASLPLHKSNIISISACRLCSPDAKLRKRRRLNELSAAEDAAHLASLDLTNLMSITFVDDPESCLHQDWATVVVINVTEFTQTPEDPCK
jgi:ferredoxin